MSNQVECTAATVGPIAGRRRSLFTSFLPSSLPSLFSDSLLLDSDGEAEGSFRTGPLTRLEQCRWAQVEVWIRVWGRRAEHDSMHSADQGLVRRYGPSRGRRLFRDVDRVR